MTLQERIQQFTQMQLSKGKSPAEIGTFIQSKIGGKQDLSSMFTREWALGEITKNPKNQAAISTMFQLANPEQSAQERKRRAALQQVVPILAQLKEEVQGTTGGLKGWVRGYLGTLGLMEGKEDEALHRLTRGYARAIANALATEVGVATDKDVERWLGLFPRTQDSKDEQVDYLDRLMGQVQLEGAIYGVDVSPLTGTALPEVPPPVGREIEKEKPYAPGEYPVPERLPEPSWFTQKIAAPTQRFGQKLPGALAGIQMLSQVLPPQLRVPLETTTALGRRTIQRAEASPVTGWEGIKEHLLGAVPGAAAETAGSEALRYIIPKALHPGRTSAELTRGIAGRSTATIPKAQLAEKFTEFVAGPGKEKIARQALDTILAEAPEQVSMDWLAKKILARGGKEAWDKFAKAIFTKALYKGAPAAQLPYRALQAGRTIGAGLGLGGTFLGGQALLKRLRGR